VVYLSSKVEASYSNDHNVGCDAITGE